MPVLREFHKPTDLSTALALLRRESPRTRPLAGGTWLNPRIGKEVQAEAVIDLSGLGLRDIEHDADTLRLGPMATLAAVTEDETCRSLASGILADTARRDAAVNVRNVATVGGTLVVAPVDSEFILALLALAAELDTRSAQSEKTSTQSLSRFLADPVGALDGGLVTQVRLHLPQRATGGLARVGRTPSDHPIVAAVAVVTGDTPAARIALGGVAPRPLLVELKPAHLDGHSVPGKSAAVAQAIAAAEPYADFRGTVDYRRAMGELMATRALALAFANYERAWEVQWTSN